MRILLLLASTVALAEPVTFLRDVAPILNKASCTSGTCHGAAKGKNGFKLSLRGYDPQFDYEALLYDLSGRRFNRADPSRSLMLAKPTQQVAHGGGLRFEKDSPYYRTIFNWIAQGVPFGDPAKDNVAALDVVPAEVAMPRPGEKMNVKIVARFGDGLTRDVTNEAVIESNSPTVATVDAKAAVSGERVGEATLLVRYQGKYATIPVNVLNPKPGFAWKAQPQYNYVDQLIDAKLQKLHIQPSGLCTDAEFLRRVTVDLIGQLPTPGEVREFLADPAPSKIKREKRIDKLIGSAAFADRWTVKWGDLLQSSRKFLGEKATYEFREWIHDSVAANKPYDKMVHELLTGRGSVYDNPAANYFRTTRDPKPTMEKTTQVFMGVRMVCTQCHDHPFERWTQNQYYQMAAFFSAVGLRPGYEVGEEIVYDQRSDYEMHHPKDNRVMAPQFLVAAIGGAGGAIKIPSDEKRRDAFADWLVSKDNPFFAKAIANRIWSYFLGRGIIDPVDDIRASNPAVNAPLLAALTKDLTDHQFDLQHLMRVIVKSRTYQASFLTNEWNALDGDNFSHAIPRRLSAEPLMDAVTQAAGVRPNFPEVPEDTTASQLPDPHVGADGFLDLFGRPSRESSCECERRADFSLPQALNLVNGTTISDAVGDSKGRIAKNVLAGMTDAAMVDDLYLATLTRLPTRSEAENALRYMAGGPQTLKAQDLLWALLNSKGFLYVY